MIWSAFLLSRYKSFTTCIVCIYLNTVSNAILIFIISTVNSITFYLFRFSTTAISTICKISIILVYERRAVSIRSCISIMTTYIYTTNIT